MSQFFRYLIFTIFVVLSSYYAWSEGDRRIGEREYIKLSATVPSLEIKSIGYDHESGNLVAVQAFMNVLDYSSPERFYAKLDSYLAEAKKRGYTKENTIILFPEHIGTPLVLLGEKKDVYAANTASSALSLIGFGNLFGYFKTSLSGANPANAGEIIFKMKSAEMKSVYADTFRKLSTLYKVTIIAGSILLPEPEIQTESNEILIKNGRLTNSTFIFLANGKIYNKTGIKHNLGKSEKLIAIPSKIEHSILQFKNVGIVLSNDSLYNLVYGEKGKNIEILLSPSAIIENEEIDWTNEDIHDEKETINSNLNQSELWKKYGIFDKTKASQTNRVNIQVVLLGKFFDFTLQGETSALIRYVAGESLGNKSPGILNVWF